MMFRRGERVTTPRGPGVVDGYGYPPTGAGRSQEGPSHLWVWLDEGKFGTRELAPFRLDETIERISTEEYPEAPTFHDIAVRELERARDAVAGWGLPNWIIDEYDVEPGDAGIKAYQSALNEAIAILNRSQLVVTTDGE
jgi:hypothetical protein